MKRQVVERIIRGNINKQIARTLGATERTIKVHRQRVMEKMQVRTLAELVSLAERVGRCVGYGQTTSAFLVIQRSCTKWRSPVWNRRALICVKVDHSGRARFSKLSCR